MNESPIKTDKEFLTPVQRRAELAIIGGMLLLAAVLIYHQTARTGFFTTRFGVVEMVCLYGPIVVSFAAPLIRAITGRRNPARPFDAATSLCLAAGSLWLLLRFPFDFTHLGDFLPGGLHFLLGWVTDPLGRIPLMLQVVIGPISAVTTMMTYFSVRGQEPEPRLKRPAS